MKSIINTCSLADFLIAKGLLPPRCQNVEILIGVNTALRVRYEVLVDADVLAQWGESMSQTAMKYAADDERNRLAQAEAQP